MPAVADLPHDRPSAPEPESRWHTPRVVTTAALVVAITSPGQTAGLSILVDPIIDDLDIARSVVSTAYMLGSLSGALAMPLVGKAVDRYGPRRVLLSVVIAFGGILLAAATVSNLVGLGLAFIGLRMTGQGAMPLVATTAVAIYVVRRRGLAQGLTAAFGAAGISLTPVLLETLAADHGFRTVWIIEGLTVWAIAIPLVLFGLPPRPAYAGHSSGKDNGPAVTAPGDWTPRQARRTGFFWVVTASIAAVSMLATGVNFHQIALLGERGLTPAEAAANFLPQTSTGLTATVIAGAVADRVSPRVIMIVCMSALAGALVAGGFVQPGLSAFAFGAALGVAGNGLRVLEATTFPNTYGLSHVGAIRGYVTSATVGASAFGPVALSLGHDLAGSYRPVLLTTAVIPVMVAVAAVFTRLPARNAEQTSGHRTTAVGDKRDGLPGEAVAAAKPEPTDR